VREAVRLLIARGLLQVSSGKGTVVCAPSTQTAAESMTLVLSLRSGGVDYRKVVEVRRILEVEIAGLAASRRLPENLLEMQKILEREASNLADPALFVETDVAFHSSLARATQNELFLVLLGSISNILVEARQLALRLYPEVIVRALRHHYAIFGHIKDSDPDSARRAMSEHMDEAEATMRQALDRS
jgi:GntR family transcriptional repressor for pyruvate dehydrogenase complex